MTTKKTTNEVRQGQTSGHLRYVLAGSMALSTVAAFVFMSAF